LRCSSEATHGPRYALLIGRNDLAEVFRVHMRADSAVEPTKSEKHQSLGGARHGLGEVAVQALTVKAFKAGSTVHRIVLILISDDFFVPF
jgi:hypothetical protein